MAKQCRPEFSAVREPGDVRTVRSSCSGEDSTVSPESRLGKRAEKFRCSSCNPINHQPPRPPQHRWRAAACSGPSQFDAHSPKRARILRHERSFRSESTSVAIRPRALFLDHPKHPAAAIVHHRNIIDVHEPPPEPSSSVGESKTTTWESVRGPARWRCQRRAPRSRFAIRSSLRARRHSSPEFHFMLEK